MKPDIVGVGIDREEEHFVSDRVLRFFLNDVEMTTIDTSSEWRLRLWTVKEALFKAMPENSDVMLLDFVVHDPHAWVGSAMKKGCESYRFDYFSKQSGSGAITTVALCIFNPNKQTQVA